MKMKIIKNQQELFIEHSLYNLNKNISCRMKQNDTWYSESLNKFKMFTLMILMMILKYHLKILQALNSLKEDMDICAIR